MKKAEMFAYTLPEGKPVELEVYIAGGPLCVGPVFHHVTGGNVPHLYWIYLRAYSARMGPFFTTIPLAGAAMQKILKKFGRPFFEQPLDWIQRQASLRDWVAANIGVADDLVGGQWSYEEKEPK